MMVKTGDVVWVISADRPNPAQGTVVSSDEDACWALVEHDGEKPGPFSWGWADLVCRDQAEHPFAWSKTVLDKIEETNGANWTTLVRVREGHNCSLLIYVGMPSVKGMVWWRISVEKDVPTIADGTNCHPPYVPICGDAHLTFRGAQILKAPDGSLHAPTVRKALDLLRRLNKPPASPENSNG